MEGNLTEVKVNCHKIPYPQNSERETRSVNQDNLKIKSNK